MKEAEIPLLDHNLMKTEILAKYPAFRVSYQEQAEDHGRNPVGIYS